MVHRVKREWMEARLKYLNASAIKEMLPTTETGRKRTAKQIESARIKALARTFVSHVTDDALVSTGPAARGHILEPYAIADFNDAVPSAHLYHWDDVVCTDGVLGWSPDAVSVPSPEDVVETTDKYCAENIGEVKSYGTEKHVAKMFEAKESCEERWQLACGMYLWPNVQSAYLIFYDPDCDVRLHWKEYTRDDLEDEIEQIGKVIQGYIEWRDKLTTRGLNLKANSETSLNSDEILAREQAKQSMNPQ